MRLKPEFKPEYLYLDLLKKTLCFALWPEPAVPVDSTKGLQIRAHRMVFRLVRHFFKGTDIQLYRARPVAADARTDGTIWPIYAHTMIGLKRLDNLQFCIETVLEQRIPGDLIETGVWRGGAAIFMRGVLAVYGVENRRVFVADSFEGLPKPGPDSHPSDARDTLYMHKYLAVSENEVADNFRKYGLLDDQVVFLKGWFKDTMPSVPVECLSVLRLDGDMYDSTMEVLTHLYPKLSVGGFCIVDDYVLPACRRAVDDYRQLQKIETPMVEVDWTGYYWRKE